MAGIWMPDEIWSDYGKITPALCQAAGIRVILTDLDNTLAPYEQPLPDEKLKDWLAALSAAGIQVAILSNNHGERVDLFARSLGVPYFPDAHKPLVKVARGALAALGGTPGETAMLGDQLLTDAWCGRRLRCARVWIVPPIRDKKNWFFRAKRMLERPVIRCYLKKRALDVTQADSWPCQLSGSAK